MATVYLADDLKHERKIALKALKPELATVVGAERFLAEIKTTANLQHPHILPLHDSGEADSFLYYVMPHVEGETLRDRLDREHQLPVDEAVRIAADVAEAVQAAHEQGVIHRDIKPANILLGEGRPLVADFGIALAVSAAGGGRLTETGLSLGTPHYMSPEQATGDQPVGASTDTYALGSVLYEMLVGEPPYPRTTAQAVLGKIIAGKPVSATEQRPAIPANVDASLRKALEKLPADRFTGAQGFARALADPGFRHGEVVGSEVVPGTSPFKRLTLGSRHGRACPQTWGASVEERSCMPSDRAGSVRSALRSLVSFLTAAGAAASGPTGAAAQIVIDGAPPPVAPATITRDAEGRPTVRATRLTEPLRLDGALDEEVYRSVQPFGDFVQVEPEAGAPATESSDVWVLFDDSHIYVSARYWDSAPPEEWVANELRRDTGQLRQNDTFGVGFDTFYDRRSGFMFYTNPLGALAEYAIIDEGAPNADWNPVWEVRTGRFEGGWTVEMAIPFKSLRYRSGESQVWGFQLRRAVRRKNEWVYLSPVPEGVNGGAGLGRVSAAGTLVGLDLPQASRNVEIKPYAISRVTTAAGSTRCGRATAYS